MKNKYLLLLLVGLLIPFGLEAHAPNQSYIFLRVYEDGIGGRFEITTDDLNRALSLDLERGLTLEDLSPYLPRIQEYYLKNVTFSSEAGAHPIHFDEVGIMPIDLGDFVLLNFTLEEIDEVPEVLDIGYQVLFDLDPTHQGLQVIEYSWKAGIYNNEAIFSLIFGKGETHQPLDLTGSSIMLGFIIMIRSGMHHIYIGLDHILFLLALLLPAVVRRQPELVKSAMASNQKSLKLFPGFLKPYAAAWKPVGNFKLGFIYLLKIVTFFTLAHTITLSLAALEIIKLPSALVESIIALSIALAAVHNIYPILAQGREWIIAFGFGLFHGFGFASVLGDIGLHGESMTLSLLGFNLGVEVGQVIIVCVIFPVLFLLRKTKIYTPILMYGSIFLILIALSWFFDRSLGIDLLLDNFVEEIYAKILSWLRSVRPSRYF